MTKLIFIVVLCMVMSNCVCQMGISFQTGLTWQEIVSEARRVNKYIFVDCFTTWCGPCKEMEKDIFPSPKLGVIFNERFISVRLQCDTGRNDDDNTKRLYADALELKEKYRVTAFPTLLFFDTEGKIVHRAVGKKSEEEMLAIADAAVNEEKQYYTLLGKFRADSLNKPGLYYLSKYARQLGEDSLSNRVADRYINAMAENEIYDPTNIEFINQFTKTSDSRGFRIFYENGKKINTIMSKEGYVDNMIMNVVISETPEIKDRLMNIDMPDWDMIYSNLTNRFNSYYADRIVAWIKVPYYKQKEDWQKYTASLVPFVELFGKNIHFVFLNNYAWDIFVHSEKKSELMAALSWSKKIVQAESEDASYIDTYANLLFKLGEKVEAIKWQARAVQLDSSNRELKTTLKRMQAESGKKD